MFYIEESSDAVMHWRDINLVMLTFHIISPFQSIFMDSLDSLQAFMGLVQMGRLMWCTVAGGASGDVAVDR